MARTWTATVDIDAPVTAVWAVLVDFDAYPSWNPFTRVVKSTLRLGELVQMDVDMGSLGMVHQDETLVHLEPARRIAWALDQWPRWLLWARRTQTLEVLADHRTRYLTEDVIGGLLSAIVAWRYGPSLVAGFSSMAQALRVEVTRREDAARHGA